MSFPSTIIQMLVLCSYYQVMIQSSHPSPAITLKNPSKRKGKDTVHSYSFYKEGKGSPQSHIRIPSHLLQLGPVTTGVAMFFFSWAGSTMPVFRNDLIGYALGDCVLFYFIWWRSSESVISLSDVWGTGKEEKDRSQWNPSWSISPSRGNVPCGYLQLRKAIFLCPPGDHCSPVASQA